MFKKLRFVVRAIIVESVAVAAFFYLPNSWINLADQPRQRPPAQHQQRRQSTWPANAMLVDFQLESPVPRLQKQLSFR